MSNRLDLDPDLNPWEKQPDEGDAPFEAFKIFKDMPPDERHLDTVYEIWKGHPPPTPNRSVCKRYSYTHRWPERVEAWDKHLENQRIAKVVDVLGKSQEMLLSFAPALLKKLIAIGLTGDGSHFQVRALQDLLDRAGMKPVDKLQIDGLPGQVNVQQNTLQLDTEDAAHILRTLADSGALQALGLDDQSHLLKNDVIDVSDPQSDGSDSDE